MRRKRKWDASCLANSFNAPRFIFAARAMRLFTLFSMWKMFRKMFSQLLRLLPHTVCRLKYSSSPRHIVAAAPLTGEHVFNVNVISLCQRKDLKSFEPKTNSLINIIFFVSPDTVIPFLYGHWIGVARVVTQLNFTVITLCLGAALSFMTRSELLWGARSVPGSVGHRCSFAHRQSIFKATFWSCVQLGSCLLLSPRKLLNPTSRLFVRWIRVEIQGVLWSGLVLSRKGAFSPSLEKCKSCWVLLFATWQRRVNFQVFQLCVWTKEEREKQEIMIWNKFLIFAVPGVGFIFVKVLLESEMKNKF